MITRLPGSARRPAGACDLHIHTSASDGSVTPSELATLASDAGLDAIAITDHDTTAGIVEGARAAAVLGLEFVPGIEINTDVGSAAVDVLGYFFEPTAPPLADLMARIVRARIARADAIVEALHGLGVPLDRKSVDKIAAGASIGRPHIARAMVEAGVVPDVGTAFRDYVGRGAPAYVDRYPLLPEDACSVIRAAGGVPGLAHPLRADQPHTDPLRLLELLPRLVDSGLGALECYYPGFTIQMTRRLLAMAAHFGLVPTGGSDYHGPWHAGHELGAATVPLANLDRLRKSAGSRQPQASRQCAKS